MEADDVSHTQHPADKDVVALVEFDAGRVTLVTHVAHGSTPARRRNSRASST
ncbi:hypothetical protein D3C76_1511960 [compost metagenome]